MGALMEFGEFPPTLNLPEEESSFKMPLTSASSGEMQATLRDTHSGTGHLWQSHMWKRAFPALENPVSGLMGYGKGARRCYLKDSSKPVPNTQSC